MKKKVLCNIPFEHSLISCDGSVRCCCYQSPENSMGNLNEQSFEEIWLGDEFQKIRKQMLSMDYPSICRCKEQTGHIGLQINKDDYFIVDVKEELLGSPKTIDIGAFYYIWYNDPSWYDKCARNYLIEAQYPTLGIYESLDEKIISQHIDWANKCGIKFFIIALDQAMLESGNFDKFVDKYTKICDNKDFFPKLSVQIETLSFFKKDVKLDELDMLKFKYILERIEKKIPVHIRYFYNEYKSIFFYVSREIVNIDEFIKFVRKEFPDLYLFGDEVWYYEEISESRISMFDAIYSYNMYLEQVKSYNIDNTMCKTGKDYFDMVKYTYDRYYRCANKFDTKFVPHIMPRYNDMGVRGNLGHYILPEDNLNFFKQYIDFSMKYVDDILLVTSWNEWYEDTQIEPCGNFKNYGLKCNQSISNYDYTQGYDHTCYGFDCLKEISKINNIYFDEDDEELCIASDDRDKIFVVDNHYNKEFNPSFGKNHFSIFEVYNAFKIDKYIIDRIILDKDFKLVNIKNDFDEHYLTIDFEHFEEKLICIIKVQDNYFDKFEFRKDVASLLIDYVPLINNNSICELKIKIYDNIFTSYENNYNIDRIKMVQ